MYCLFDGSPSYPCHGKAVSDLITVECTLQVCIEDLGRRVNKSYKTRWNEELYLKLWYYDRPESRIYFFALVYLDDLKEKGISLYRRENRSLSLSQTPRYAFRYQSPRNVKCSFLTLPSQCNSLISSKKTRKVVRGAKSSASGLIKHAAHAPLSPSSPSLSPLPKPSYSSPTRSRIPPSPSPRFARTALRSPPQSSSGSSASRRTGR